MGGFLKSFKSAFVALLVSTFAFTSGVSEVQAKARKVLERKVLRRKLLGRKANPAKNLVARPKPVQKQS
jgi:hypothetical protein